MPHPSPDQAEDALLTPRQVAARLRVDPSTLRDWAGKGHGPARIVLSPQTVRYRASEVDRWIEERAAGSGNSVATVA